MSNIVNLYYVLAVTTVSWNQNDLHLHEVIYHDSEDNDAAIAILRKVMVQKAFTQFMYHYSSRTNNYLKENPYWISDDESKWDYQQKLAFILDVTTYFKLQPNKIVLSIGWYKHTYRIFDCMSCKDVVVKEEDDF